MAGTWDVEDIWRLQFLGLRYRGSWRVQYQNISARLQVRSFVTENQTSPDDRRPKRMI